jgi:hypothetical protein
VQSWHNEGSYADAVADKGQRILGTAAVNAMAPDDQFLEISFSLLTPCDDFEIRLWVTEQSDLTVSTVEIEPVRAAPVPANPPHTDERTELPVTVDLKLDPSATPRPATDNLDAQKPVVAMRNGRQTKAKEVRDKKSKRSKSKSGG